MELVILSGDMEGTRFALDKPNITLGRKSDNDICMPLDPRISRFHAQLTRRDDGAWVLEDLDSINGTFVGQRRIHDPTVLRPNDRFRMGRTWMLLQDQQPSAPRTQAVEAVRLADAEAHAFELDNVVYSVAADHYAEAERDVTQPREYLQVYRQVSRALSSTLDIDELCNAIMDAVMDCLPAERAFLLLLDRDSAELITKIARQRLDAPKTDHTITISRHMVDKAINERATILTHDAMTDERFQELASVRDFRIRSAVCAPLVHQENVLGVIYLDTISTTHVFGEQDVDLLASVASQASVAIENASLFTDLRNAYDNLKAAQQQLVHSEKLSTIGALAATVAHDMINIVTPMQPLIDLMVRGGDVDTESEEAVRRQTKRLAALAERLMSFSQFEELDLQPMSINDIVASTLALINTEFRHQGVKLDTELSPDLPPAMIDENQMDRVFLNLCMNALEALHNTDDPRLIIRSYRDQDEVVVSFTDNGPGIPADLEHDIFEPFYTTKETGTGLGLFSCRRIVQADHGGVIEYESEPGQRTTFTVRLPAISFSHD